MRFVVALALGGGMIVFGTATPAPYTGIMVLPVVIGAIVVIGGVWLELRRGAHL